MLWLPRRNVFPHISPDFSNIRYFKSQTKSHPKATKLASCFSPYRATEAPGAGIPKNGEKLQNSPPRSNPRKWGKITEKLQKILRKYIFCNFSVIFPHFRGLDRGGEFCNFFPFFGDSRPGGFRGSVRGKTTRNTKRTSAGMAALTVLDFPRTYTTKIPNTLLQTGRANSCVHA